MKSTQGDPSTSRAYVWAALIVFFVSESNSEQGRTFNASFPIQDSYILPSTQMTHAAKDQTMCELRKSTAPNERLLLQPGVGRGLWKDATKRKRPSNKRFATDNSVQLQGSCTFFGDLYSAVEGHKEDKRCSQRITPQGRCKKGEQGWEAEFGD